MDTMKIMLGMTIGLLLALVVLQFSQLDGKRSDELAQLRLENARLADEKNRQAQQPSIPQPAVTAPAEPSPEMLEMQAKLEQLEKERAERAAADARKLLEEEANTPDPAEVNRNKKRANLINSAMLLATVESYMADQGFMLLTVKDFGNVREGSVLGIRRNGGIAGRINVFSTDEIEGTAIAEPVTGSFFDGEVVINSGDEIILPPIFLDQ